MAEAFNLTAQLNLRGPSNIRQIVSDVKKQIGTITGEVKFKIDASTINNTSKLNQVLQSLNTNLASVGTNAQSASAAMRSFGQSVSGLGSSSSKLSSNISKAVKSTDNLGKVSAKASKNISVTRTEMEEFGRQSALAVRRFAAFSAVTGVFFGLSRAINNGLKSFIEFDRQLVRLQQVTGQNAEGLRGLQDEIAKLAAGLGVSSDSLIQVSATLAQAGLSASETRAALEALAKSELAPSFDNINQTVEGSIALMRQFGISANELEKALGSVNSVSAAFAVEAGDIIAAIQRTGGVFAAASKGVSSGTDALNEFIAIFTSVRQTTRESAETIATGLRTIFTRIQRGGTIEALKEFGVTLTDAEGKFVGAYKAIQLLSEGLNRIDPRDLRFSQIVEELGGFRQIGKVIPLIQQFATAQEALKVAQAGQGSLAADAAKAQLSLANQIAKVREEFLTLIRGLGQSDAFQTLARGALGFASGLIKISGALKGVLPALTILAAGSGLRALSQFTGGFIGGLKKVPQGGPGGNQQSVAGSIGSNLGASLVGAKTEQVSRDLDQNSAALDKVSGKIDNLTASLNSLDSNFTNINSTLNNYNTLLQQSIASLASNTTSLDNLTNAINNLSLGGGPTTVRDGGKILGFNKGGVVPGSGKGDKIPALLEPGEVVMSNRAVSKYGRGNLVRMNKYWSGGSAVSGPIEQSRQKFAKGGPILVKTAASAAGGRGQQGIASYYDKNIQERDRIYGNIERKSIGKQEVENFYKAKGTQLDPNTHIEFAKDIRFASQLRSRKQNTSDDRYKLPFSFAKGFAFEDFMGEYLKIVEGKPGYSKSLGKYDPLDFVGGGDPIEVRFRDNKTSNATILAKRLKYALQQKQSLGFTPAIDDRPPVDVGSTIIYEIDSAYKKALRLKSGGLIQKFIDGGWVKRMQSYPTKQLNDEMRYLYSLLDLYDLGEGPFSAKTFDGNKREDIGKREAKQRIKAIDEHITARKEKDKQQFSNRRGSGLQPTEQYDTQEMLDAITYYQAGSGPFTKALSAGKKTFKDPRGEQYKTQDIKDRLLAASQFQIPKKTYSGLGRSQLREILSDTGVTPKQLSSKPSEVLKTLVGKNIDFPTFLSVSAMKAQAEPFVQNPGALLSIDGSSTSQKTIDVIKAKNKTAKATTKSKSRRLPGLDKISSKKLDFYDEEQEFIIPPNVGFRITKATGKVSSDFSRDLKDKKLKEENDFEMYWPSSGDDYFEKTKINLAAQMLRSGGLIQKFMSGSAGGVKAKPEPFGTGATKFPRRISNAYAKQMEKEETALRFDRLIQKSPINERIMVDEAMEQQISQGMRQPLDREQFASSFRRAVLRDEIASNISNFAKLVGLPEEDLSVVLPRQLDFGSGSGPIGSRGGRDVLGGAFTTISPYGSRGAEGWDLSEFGYTKQDEQDLFGFEKLLEEKKKEREKIRKTPTRTFDDGSTSFDLQAYDKASDEYNALNKQIYDIRTKRDAAISAANKAREEEVASSGRATLGFGTRFGKAQNPVFYHELTHQLFKGLRAKSADSFDKYKQRVTTLFETDNDGLVDAFDALNAGYSSADVVYGRAYKLDLLGYKQREEIRKDPAGEEAKNLSSLIKSGTDAKKATQFRPINPSFNEAMLKFYSQEHLDKVEDNGKEEFLTTLVEKMPVLDQRLQGILDSTMTELLGGAGIQRQKYLDGGWVERMKTQPDDILRRELEMLHSGSFMLSVGERKVLASTFAGLGKYEDIGKRELVARMQVIKDYLDERAINQKAKYARRRGPGLQATEKYNEQEMLDAVNYYAAGSGPFTKALVSGAKTFKEPRGETYKTKDIKDRLLAASQFTIPKKTYSGLGRSQFREILSDTNTTPKKLATKTDETLRGLVGQTIDFPTFLSVSAQKDQAEAFVQNPGALLSIDGSSTSQKTIDVVKARRKTQIDDSAIKSSRRLKGVENISEKKLDIYEEEQEFIIPPNVGFKITKATGKVYQDLSAKDLKSKSKKALFDDLDMFSDTDIDDFDKTKLDIKVQMLRSGGTVQKFMEGGVAQRKLGYIDYDVIANPDNEAVVSKGMEDAGVKGPRLYADYLTDLAVKARKDNSLQKLRAIYGVAGAGKTTLARGQGTDKGTLRETERFPVLSPEDIQRATEVIVLSSSVSKDTLDNVFSATDRTYTLSSTTKDEREAVYGRKVSRDITGKGQENRKPGSTLGVSTDSAVGEALIGDRLGDKSVVLARTEDGRLRRKRGDELVDVVRKDIDLMQGSFSPFTGDIPIDSAGNPDWKNSFGHISMLAASRSTKPSNTPVLLVGPDQAIDLDQYASGKTHSGRNLLFPQELRMLLARAASEQYGAIVVPKKKDFAVPQAFDITEDGANRRKVLVAGEKSRALFADKTDKDAQKYEAAGYKTVSLKRTASPDDNEAVSGTRIRDMIMSGDLGGLQKVLSPQVYEIISNNLAKLQNRSRALPAMIDQVKQDRDLKLQTLEQQIKATGISKIVKSKMDDPEYAAKVQALEELRSQRDQIKSSASFRPYRLLSELATSQPEQYALDFSQSQVTIPAPVRTVKDRALAAVAAETSSVASVSSGDAGVGTGQSLLDNLATRLTTLGGESGLRALGVSIPPDLQRRVRTNLIKDGVLDTAIVTGLIEKAEAIKKRKQDEIDGTRHVAMAGLQPLDYSRDPEWELDDGRKYIATIRGFKSSYLQDIERFRARQKEAALEFGRDTTATEALGLLGQKTVQGPPRSLAIDFDDTLAFGTKMLDSSGKEDISAYYDEARVREVLSRATPTRLAQRLAEIEKDQPGTVRAYTRVLTARAESLKHLVTETLNRFGLPYTDSDITGVGQRGDNDRAIARKKGDNLSAIERFIDDSEKNISVAQQKGIQSYRYSEPKAFENASDYEPFGAGNIEGALLEQTLAMKIGRPIDFEALEQNRALDFPNGLGAAASLFGLPPNIETEVKRTLNKDSFTKARSEFSRYFKENPEKYNAGGIVASFAKGGKPDYYSLEKSSGLSSGEFDGMVRYAKTNDFSLDEFRSYLSKRAADKKSRVGSVIDPKSLQSFLMHGAVGPRLGTGDLTEEQKKLAEMLKGPPDPQYDPNRFAKGGKALPTVHDIGEKLSSEFNLTKGKTNAWNQLENNCLQIANKAADMFGYESSEDKVRRYLTNFQQIRVGKQSPAGFKPTPEVLAKSPMFRKLVNSPASADSTGNIVVREGEELMRHVSFEHMNKEYNFGAAGPNWPIVLRIPLKKKKEIEAAYGGLINRFADGGTVPALVSNGEAYVPPKMAKKIGYGTLNQMNQADRNGMGRFSQGGISVFKGPGTGTSDSIPTSLPVGSFIIREKATKALGLNKGGGVGVGIKRFAVGGKALGDSEASVQRLMIEFENLVKATKLRIYEEQRAAGASTQAALAAAKTAANMELTSLATQKYLDSLDPTSDIDPKAINEALARIKADPSSTRLTASAVQSSRQPVVSGAATVGSITAASIKAAEALALMTAKAKENGQTLTQYQQSLKQNLVNLAKDLQKAAPQKISNFGQTVAGLTGRLRSGDVDAKSDATDILTKQLSDIASNIDPKELQSTVDDLIESIASGNGSFVDIINSSQGLQKIFTEAGSDAGALQKALASLSATTSIPIEALERLADASDVTASNMIDKNVAASQKYAGIMAKVSIGMAAIGSTLSGAIKMFGGEFSKSTAMSAAAVEAFGSTVGVVGSAVSQLPSTFSSIQQLTQAGGMLSGTPVGGAINKVAQGAIGLLSNPFVMAGAGIGVAAVGLAAAFKEAHNAAREFEKQMASRNLENSLNKINTLFDEFSKDMSKKDILGDITNELNSAISAAFVGIKLDATVPKMFWTNMIDAAMGGSDSAQRSMILEKQGIGAYLQSSAFGQNPLGMMANATLLGIPDAIAKATTGQSMFQGSTDAAARNREGYMFELATQLAAQQSASLKPVADNAFKLFEQRLRSGSSVNDIMKELKDAGGGVSQFASAIARSNPIIEEQIIKTQARADLNEIEKQQIIENIIAREAEKQTILNTTATMRAMEFEKLNKGISKFINSLERIYSNMEMSINRASFEVQKLSDSAELVNSSLSGGAKAGETRLSAVNILQNRRAYSSDEEAGAIDLASSFFGPASPAISAILNIGDKLETSILSTINRTRRAEPGATNERVLASIRSNLDKTLSDLQIPDNLVPKLSEQIKNALKDITTAGDLDSVSFEQIAEAVPGLTKQIDAARRAQEVAVKALEFYQGQLTEYANSMNAMVDLQFDANKDFAKASDILSSSVNELSKTFGREISLREVINNSLAKTRRQTGGATDPTDITRNILNLENSRKILQDASNSAANKGPSGKDEFQLMQNRLRNTNLALRQNYDALKNLAENTDIASAALAKIQDIQAKRQAGANLIERMVTSSPEELSKLNRAMGRLNNNMQGIANRGTTSEQRGESLQLFNQIAPLLGDGSTQNALKANVLESQLLESGMGINPMFAQVLDSLRNPEGDPEMQEAISIYKAGNALQATANEKLGELKQVMVENNAEDAANKLKIAIEGAKLTFDQQLFSDIKNEIINLKDLVAKRGAAVGLASGGVVYASAGQSIDFAPRGTDTVPAMLTPGEFVVNRKATKNNLPLLQNINSGKYSKGGRVNYLSDGGIVPGDDWASPYAYTRADRSRQKEAKYETERSFDTFLKKPTDWTTKSVFLGPASSYASIDAPTTSSISGQPLPNTEISIPFRPTAKAGFSAHTIRYYRRGGLYTSKGVISPNIPWTEVKLWSDLTNTIGPEKHLTEDEVEEYQSGMFYNKFLAKYYNNNILKKLKKITVNPPTLDKIPKVQFGRNLFPFAPETFSMSDLSRIENNKIFALPDDPYGQSHSSVRDALTIDERFSKFPTNDESSFSMSFRPRIIPTSKSFQNLQQQSDIVNIDQIERMKKHKENINTINIKTKKGLKEKDLSKQIKTNISLLDDLYNNKIFQAEFTRESDLFYPSGPVSGVALPITLYNTNKAKWQQRLQEFNNSPEKDKTFAWDNFVDLYKYQNTQFGWSKDPASRKDFAWTSNDVEEPIQNRALSLKNTFGLQGQDIFGAITTEDYGQPNTLKPFFSYQKISKGATYDHFAKKFTPLRKPYRIVSRTQNNQSPFDSLGDNEKLFIPEDNWKTFENILEQTQSQYDNDTGKLIKLGTFQYGFNKPMGAFIPVKDTDIDEQYRQVLQDWIKAGAILPWDGLRNTVVDGSLFKKTLEDRAAEIAKNKGVDSAKKGFDIALDANDTWTNAKKVGIARAVYDIGKETMGIQAAKPTSIDGIASIISELSAKATELSRGEQQAPNQRIMNPAWLINDAYRAFFTELYKGQKDTPAFLKGLGLPISTDAFDQNTPSPMIPVKGRQGKTEKAYLDYLPANKDKIKTVINNIINREMMMKSMSGLAASITDEEQTEATIKAGTARIQEQDGKQDIVPQSFKDIFDIGLNPRNIFPTADFRTTKYLNVLEDLYKTGTDQQGNLVFNVGDPQYLTAAKSIDQLKTWYGTHQDMVLNTGLDKDQLEQNKQNLATGSPLELQNKQLYSASQDANAFLTGNIFGQLPNANQLSSLIDLEIIEPIKRAKGGLIYASAGQLVNYQPRGTDTVPAMLTPGEFVINRQSTQKYRPVLEAINSGTYSRGGIVNYLNQGGYIFPKYYENAGNVTSGNRSGSFDFTNYMNSLAISVASSISEAFDKAVNNLKQPNNTSGGVSSNSQELASIDNFVNRLNNIANILSNIYIPPQITITGKHDVVVTINGDTVLNQLRPDIAGIVVSAIKGAFTDLKAKNPENNTINFDIDIDPNKYR